MRWNLAGAALLVIGFSGCASLSVVSNYSAGTVVSATVGYPLVDVEIQRRDISGSGQVPARQLVYGGRSGDTIKFTYRQFYPWRANNLTQELQFDLSKSKRITFQEMRLEVIEATSERLTARVLPAASEDYRGLPLEPGDL
jgi:hypothetical protein